jgi:tRNA(adenine34) deaminase
MSDSTYPSSCDNEFMDQALELACQAFNDGEVPIGAVVINCDGKIIGKGYNQVERYHCQNYHAEVQAIKEAGIQLGHWRLIRCTLYVTLEPCRMCMSLAALSRVERIVYGASSPLFGYSLDKEATHTLYSRHIKNITSGVRSERAASLLKDFFKKGRMRE